MQYALDPQSQEIKVNVQSIQAKRAQLEDKFHFMLLATDVTSRALFQATDHDVIQRVAGGVDWRPTPSVQNTAEVLAETLPERFSEHLRFPVSLMYRQ